MAWSDAARAAAAMARRAHARARGSIAKSPLGVIRAHYSKKSGVGRGHRRMLARAIRANRKGTGGANYTETSALMHRAALSTALRNFRKRGY